MWVHMCGACVCVCVVWCMMWVRMCGACVCGACVCGHVCVCVVWCMCVCVVWCMCVCVWCGACVCVWCGACVCVCGVVHDVGVYVWYMCVCVCVCVCVCGVVCVVWCVMWVHMCGACVQVQIFSCVPNWLDERIQIKPHASSADANPHHTVQSDKESGKGQPEPTLPSPPKMKPSMYMS